MLNKRTHIMLEDETFSLLTFLAHRKKTSVGELIRRAVTKVYVRPANHKLTQRQHSYEKLLAWQKQIGTFKHLDYRRLIEDGRSR